MPFSDGIFVSTSNLKNAIEGSPDGFGVIESRLGNVSSNKQCANNRGEGHSKSASM
jgi:hypothetical protein